MPGCAAVGCNNRSEKGYIMKCFPRDPKLRKIWQERVARADWEPSNNSFLCHVHFEPEEWSIMENGRIRLKKNAIPSIFTVTSTRKSPKKRIKLANKNENECGNDMTEYPENETEYSSTGHLEEKDSDSQDVDNLSIHSFICRRVNHSPKMIEDRQVLRRQYLDITNNLEQETIILISDDNNMEIENDVKESDIENQENMGNKQSVSNSITNINSIDNQNEDVIIKTEIKREIDQTSFDDSYDEIEEKLKQICDGYHEEKVSNNIENINSVSRNQKGTSQQPVTQIPFHRSINYKYSSRSDIGNMLTDNTENIEIIFGSESGEECARLPRCTSYNNNGTNEIDKLDQHIDDIDSITNNKKIDKPSPEDIEETFSRENIHVTSNMRAAIKRKRRTREEIMKSIKKSIHNISSQDTNSVSNSDISDDIAQVENEIEKELNTSESVQFNKDYIAKFIVKVTGDREDVFDIMQDLFKGRDFTIEEYNTRVHQENNAFVTSVITIDDCPEVVEANASTRERIDDISPISIMSESNDQISLHPSTLKNKECTRIMSPHLDVNDSDINSGCLTLDSVTEQPATTNRTIIMYNYEYLKLQQKVKIQEDIIKKLNNQLIRYKDLEKDLQIKNLALELKTKKIENLIKEFNRKTGSTSSSTSYKKNDDLRQRLLEDLSNRSNHFEEVNRKLMKNVTVEYQQRRKLEGQVKQRDNRIKELNWKLEKASKFLERSEKNTNTYRRKMLNMQTFMRRKKLLNEKMSTLDEMLVDDTKEGYSEKALAMAMEIKEICGTSGYDKLLSFGFPLPPLLALRNDNFSDFNESSNDILRDIHAKHNVNKDYNTRYTKDDIVTDTQDQLETSPESACGKIVLDSTETITGTVQDIFEESNDMDDFSTNELKEQLILQLNAVM